MIAKPFIYCPISPSEFAMTKRAIAIAVTACVGLALGGCLQTRDGRAIILPLVAIDCATGGCKGSGSAAQGAGDSKVARTAAEKDRAAAEKGDAEAQYEMGTRYAAGNGVSEDDAEAARWYRESADQGFGPAQLALAFVYGTGRGIAHDDLQALMWSTLAASALAITDTTKGDAINYGEFIRQRMTPEQIAEARRRAAEWKPSTTVSPS